MFDELIVIVGIGCWYLGGFNDFEIFWINLKEGKVGILEVLFDCWNVDFYYDLDLDKLYVVYMKWGGFIDDFDKFDVDFFKILFCEVVVMDF